MKDITFWIGIIINIVVGMLWGILGVVAIIQVYGVTIIWWMLGIWLIGGVLSYWPMLTGVHRAFGRRTTDGG